MKLKALFSTIVVVTVGLVLSGFQKDGQEEPWTKKQLMPPAVLAQKLQEGETGGVFIFNIGPSGAIKNSVATGPARDAENLALLKEQLGKLPKDAEVVIYCGCCPFQHCPNIRPAFGLLHEMKFTNAKLLDLPRNLKADWIDKGYPMQN